MVNKTVDEINTKNESNVFVCSAVLLHGSVAESRQHYGKTCFQCLYISSLAFIKKESECAHTVLCAYVFMQVPYLEFLRLLAEVKSS